MPIINLTAKDVHIIAQAIRIVMELEYMPLLDYAKNSEINALRNKLQNVKDV